MRTTAIVGAMIVTALAMGSAPLRADTPPVLKISDNNNDVMTVDDTGNVVFSGSCTPSTCQTSSIQHQPGYIVWGGTIGPFTVTFTVGTTEGAQNTASPQMDLSINQLTTNTGGTITFQWTDTNYTTPSITGTTLLANGTMFGSGTATFVAYTDNTNAEFGTSIPVGPPLTVTGNGTTSINLSESGPGPSATPFSMTEVATFTLSPGAEVGVDEAFKALPSPLALKCASSTGQVGVPYSSALMASGGVPPYTYSIISGSLPAGLTLNTSTGAITGTPTQPGTFSFTAQVVDSSGSSTTNTVTANCTIVITSPPTLTVTCPASTGTVGVSYSSGLSASGGLPPYTFYISAGSLPPGLTLNAATGAITGIPTMAGTFNFTAEVVDSRNNASGTATSQCSITIAPAIAANCVTITAVQGVTITPVTMTATGGTGTGYTFSASGLPSGLTMSSTGTISGTPTVSGTFNYTVTVTDSGGNKGTFNCSVTVAPPPIAANCVTITAVQGVTITPVTMTATGGTGTGYTFSASGLPNGLTMSSTGTISGTPTVSGTFNYTVTVTDSGGNKGTFNCSVTVAPPPIAANCVTITAVQGVTITPVTMTATGGTGTGYTFSASGLPSGLTMSSTGTISGTPTVSGTFNYTVTVTDSGGNKGTFNCSVTVSSSLPACSTNLPPITYSLNNENSASAGEIVWFNSHLTKLGGTIPTSDFTIYIQNGQIVFGTSTLTVPNAIITFSSKVSCASTSFNTATNTWQTTLPLSAASSEDEIFAAGLAYVLPANFSQNVKNVTWSATIYSTAPGLQVTWQWGASNWLTQNKGTSFPMSGGQPDYNGMMIKPAHQTTSCNAGYNSGDQAGAPEFSGRSNVLTGGGSGGGGSNWTGSWSSTPPAVSFPCSTGQAVAKDEFATIGFWHNQNGQALIDSLNGGGSSTALGDWLASTFPNLYGASSSNNMAGRTNAAVAALFLQFFGVTGPKTNAQVLAGALAVYATSTTLAGGNYAAGYGFLVNTSGSGVATYNTGSDGTAIGLANNTSYTVAQLLQAANAAAPWNPAAFSALNDIFDGINQKGDI